MKRRSTHSITHRQSVHSHSSMFGKGIYLFTIGGLVAAGILAMSSGCGEEPDAPVDAWSCAAEPRADAYVAGISKTGANGYKMAILSADPAPPLRGENAWHMELRNGNGDTVDGATFVVDPQMPDHNHGSQVIPVITPAGSGGIYDISRINLWMPGYWEITIDITDGTNKDSVMFKFCVDG